MKSENVFGLETAGWPALLVNASAVVVHANPAARKLFGAALDGQAPKLSAIWSPENSRTAEQFLAHWEGAPAPSVPLKFRAQDGRTVGFLVGVCSSTGDAGKVFALQLMVETPPSARIQAADAGSAHKQKLDCALQLARTVALDFNNALTSILGHTSLILSKMEPAHPWRASLIQVEKSAAKAAEIANDLGTFSQVAREMAVLMAYAHLRASGHLGASTADELMDFATKKQWQKDIMEASVALAKKNTKYYREFVKAQQ